MTILRFEGTVTYKTGGNPESVTIGDRNVIAAVTAAFGYHHPGVTIALADERFTGDLDADEGSRGYSEWTPGDAAELRIGDHDVLARLEDLDGQTVRLWVADEPVNLLEADPPEGEPAP